MADPQNPDRDPAAVDAASAEMESTAELAQRARDGDREAMDQLFGQYVPLLSRWASGRLPGWARDMADTSDVVQEMLTYADPGHPIVLQIAATRADGPVARDAPVPSLGQ